LKTLIHQKLATPLICVIGEAKNEIEAAVSGATRFCARAATINRQKVCIKQRAYSDKTIKQQIQTKNPGSKPWNITYLSTTNLSATQVKAKLHKVLCFINHKV
jgi:hypothetical protein